MDHNRLFQFQKQVAYLHRILYVVAGIFILGDLFFAKELEKRLIVTVVMMLCIFIMIDVVLCYTPHMLKINKLVKFVQLASASFLFLYHENKYLFAMAILFMGIYSMEYFCAFDFMEGYQ